MLRKQSHTVALRSVVASGFAVAVLANWTPAVAAAGAEISFPAASSCALCHSKIPDPADERGGSIAPFALWSGSMMAHSSRDPFWKAKVREEAALTPAASAVIEDKCLRCHAPTQQYLLRGAGSGMALRDLRPDGEGVTCTVCHQISAARLGTPASFTGGFQINADNEIYGPHEKPFAMPMQHHTGLTPVESKHVLESSLCGSCHTVITPTLAADGRVTGELIEQAPYLEWLASDFPKAGVTCQKCHMPPLRDASGATAAQYIAHMPPGRWFPPTQPRKPFGQHFFAGANTAMLTLLAGIEPENAPALQRTAQRALESLRSSVSLAASGVVQRGRLVVTVDVRNLTGHKLPTGFPSRRIWLHLQAFSDRGTTLFESGAWDARSGTLTGAVERQPHRSVISRPEEVMIYQAATQDAEGRPTTSLLRAAAYVKDNRILPNGFDQSRGAQIGPVGVDGDPGFRPGSHQVRYEIALPPGVAPGRIRVEAVYQSINPAYLGKTPEFNSLAAALAPVSIASIEVLPKPGK